MTETKLYVLVRCDLPWAVRCVQAVHATACLYSHVSADPAIPAVLLGVSCEAELDTWLNKLGQAAYAFYEPDLDEQMTSIAFFSEPNEELLKLRLL